ncbi:MAG TPA: DNA-formamidopyrimidine glycosylase family protein [Armatimonadota bacterium]|nr:DNA-formamidopyrimidine glycosylase family protein [Armatimonadota bacterium]
MPELPEIHHLAKQMDRALTGRRIEAVEIRQEKCLNLPAGRFRELVEGKIIGRSKNRGKWVFTELHPEAWLLLNLGMGGDARLTRAGGDLPGTYQGRLDLDDGSVFTLRFWWFGYIHAADDLTRHKMTCDLGVNPLDKREFSLERFREMLRGRRGAIKQYLLDQRNVAGIGNVYAQDSLFMARLHPKRTIPSLSDDDIARLHAAIVDHLSMATKLGGLAYEKDLYGKPGGFSEFLVGYREGQPCPECGTAIEKIKTGSTSSFICPRCQV